MNSGSRGVDDEKWSNPSDCVDGNGGDDGGKLDPHTATQIHGPNPTKSQLIDKSQKKFGLFLVGIFEFRRKTTKSS